jgi:ribosomal protein L31
MSAVTLEDRAHALENEYFRRQEQKLINKLREKLEAEKREATPLQCLKCDGKMVESDFEGLTIEVCNKCHGVWLDTDKMARIAHQEKGKGFWFGRWFGD